LHAVTAEFEAALALEQQGRTAEAEAAYARILARRPDHAPTLHRRGVVAVKAGRLPDAEAFLRRAVAADPEAAHSHAWLGLTLRRLGRAGEAVAVYDAALRLTPDDAELHNNRGNALLNLDRPADALAAFRDAIRLRPEMVAAHANAGLALVTLERYAEALEALDRALALQPDYAPAHYSRGNALMELGRPAEARDAYRRALAASPQHALAHYGLGRALAELEFVAGEPPRESLESFGRAIALDPNPAPAHWARALARLRQGDFAGGFADYEHRWRHPDFLATAVGHVTPELQARLPAAPTAAMLDGRRVVLVGEQGVGDILMFASILPEVIARAASVALICETRLHRLLGHSFPGLELRPPGAAADGDELVLAIGSLGHLFRRAAADFPGAPYLAATGPARARWAERLGPPDDRLRIGVSWRGGIARTGAAHRSLDLARLGPLLDLPGCTFVNLQYGDTAAEIAAANATRPDNPIRDFPTDDLADFDELAGLVSNLDLVVTVQTAILHLAGALGAECLVMVARKPEWRYGAAGERLPWYRSVRLFRQGADADWAPVIDRVVDEVRRRRR
jgi:tetratricopeptide (TPR) repeat protein